MLYDIYSVMFYNMCCVMLYNMCQYVMLCYITYVMLCYMTYVMLYNMLYVMLCHITCYVMLYSICYVMLYDICYVLLWHLNCISFRCNCENFVLFALGEKYKTGLIYLADHKLLSWRNPLYLNHVIDSIFRCCGNVLYFFRLSPIQRRLSGIKNKP